MNRIFAILAAAGLFASSSPAVAGAGNFVLVNKSGGNMTTVSARRTGTTAWQPLGIVPAANARGPVQFSNPDCAFDIQANVAGVGVVTWPGVNLCEANVVILNRNESGAVWVDYE